MKDMRVARQTAVRCRNTHNQNTLRFLSRRKVEDDRRGGGGGQREHPISAEREREIKTRRDKVHIGSGGVLLWSKTQPGLCLLVCLSGHTYPVPFMLCSRLWESRREKGCTLLCIVEERGGAG